VPIAITLVLILTFFTWVGMYPGGYSAYTQNAWQCFSAGLSADPVAEDTMKSESKIREYLKSNWFLLFYLIGLIVTILIAWVDFILPKLNLKIPATVKMILDFRLELLLLLSVLLFLLLTVQWVSGFGLSRAVHELNLGQFKDLKEAATTPERTQKYEMALGAAAGASNVKTTNWLLLSYSLHLLVLLSLAVELLIKRKPPKGKIGIAFYW
jgi:magnesium-transporting ATPase (P-type)